MDHRSNTRIRGWLPYDAGLLIDYPEERCGLVVKYPPHEVSDPRQAYGFLEVRNISAQPRQHFEMDQEAMISILNDFNVIGVWHTHPTGSLEPSVMDREWHPRQFEMYIIAGLRVARWVPTGPLEFQRQPLPWTAEGAGWGRGV